MADIWYRGWSTFYSFSRFGFYQFGPRLIAGQSLLRTYVTWHMVGLPRALDEPLFMGLRLMHGQPGSIPLPTDPGESFGRLTGDWLAVETHHGFAENNGAGVPWRVVWPRDGMRFWDIKANRKADDEHIVPYLVWCLGSESFGQVAPRFTFSTLHREP